MFVIDCVITSRVRPHPSSCDVTKDCPSLMFPVAASMTKTVSQHVRSRVCFRAWPLMCCGALLFNGFSRLLIFVFSFGGMCLFDDLQCFPSCWCGRTQWFQSSAIESVCFDAQRPIFYWKVFAVTQVLTSLWPSIRKTLPARDTKQHSSKQVDGVYAKTSLDE